MRVNEIEIQARRTVMIFMVALVIGGGLLMVLGMLLTLGVML